MLKITYYGHSCFQIDINEKSVLIDPYSDDSVPGLTLPNDIKVDEVLCSHEHADHFGYEKVKTLHHHPLQVTTILVPHDDEDGKLRGMNHIHIITEDGYRIVHMGDIGRPLLDEEIRQLSSIDVLMIPVGGYYTIDSEQAFEIINVLKPVCTVLMHYRNDNVGYDVLESIDDIRNQYPIVHSLDSCTIMMENSNEYAGIFTMKHK